MDPASEATASNAFSAGGDSGKPRNPKTSASRLQSVEHALTEEHLARFASRAAAYDRENRFFEEDFEELRTAKYLLLPVPSEFGGAGMTLAEVCREQRRLAYHAPATALAVNMHLYWLGVAADLWHRGDLSLEWMLREAAGGEIFAAGHRPRTRRVAQAVAHHGRLVRKHGDEREAQDRHGAAARTRPHALAPCQEERDDTGRQCEQATP